MQDLCIALLFIWDNFKQLQDEWVMKGHTHRNEPRIYALCYYLYGTNFLYHLKMNGLYIRRGILTVILRHDRM